MSTVRKIMSGWAAIMIATIGSQANAQHYLPPSIEMESQTSGIADRIREHQTQADGTLDWNHESWWDKNVHETLRVVDQALPVSLEQLIWYAVNHSAQVQVFSDLPLIREQAIIEADAAFDWSTFFDTRWDDISDPVGNTLTVGGAGNRYLNEQATATLGLRKRTEVGGNFEIRQNFGNQDTNSNFFVPNNQGTARMTLSYTQPLLRGHGRTYNRSLVVLANLDACSAQDEFHRQLQSHLLEVTRSFWALRLERAALIQRFHLFEESVQILSDLEGRAQIDANQSQIARARAAVTQRRAELIRSSASVKNAESRIRGLVNAPQLGESNQVELIPIDAPVHQVLPVSTADSMATALHMRPEINQALKDIKGACVRMNMAKHEMLPVLNLVAETYVSGLRGSSDVGQAWTDQFNVGSPSYTIGLQYEVALGRRAAGSRLTKRQIELRQLQNRLRGTTETIKVEVEVAAREVETSYREMVAKQMQMQSANTDADYIRKRWELLPGADGNAAVVFDQLLQAQERVTQAEYDFLTAEMTYNLSLMNMKQADGTLMQSEMIFEGRVCECGVPRTILDKEVAVQQLFADQLPTDPNMHIDAENYPTPAVE